MERGERERERDIEKEISIYIYIVIIWAKFGILKGYYLGQARVIIWAKFVLHYKNRGFRRLFCSVIILYFFCAQLSCSSLKIAFSKKNQCFKF